MMQAGDSRLARAKTKVRDMETRVEAFLEVYESYEEKFARTFHSVLGANNTGRLDKENLRPSDTKGTLAFDAPLQNRF